MRMRVRPQCTAASIDLVSVVFIRAALSTRMSTRWITPILMQPMPPMQPAWTDGPGRGADSS